MASQFGVYLDDKGVADRATVLVDLDGVVRHASSVGVGGRREADALLAVVKSVHAGRPMPHGPPRAPGRLADDATLYVRDGCRFCAGVLRAVVNLKCGSHVRVRNVNHDPTARADLDAVAGADAKVPVLVQRGTPQPESDYIVRTLAELYVLR